MANMAGSGNNKQEPNFFTALSFIIAKHFPFLPLEQLELAVENGIIGKYDEGGHIPITSATIFRWIRKRQLEYIAEENKKIEDNTPDFNRLLFAGLAVIDQDTKIYKILEN